jgi:collagenase-like PrtC family protease
MLIVPTTFEAEFLERLTNYPVSSVYGSLATEHGGRAKNWLPAAGEEALAEHIAQCRSLGIDFIYTMNATCSGGHEFTAEGQRWLAERLGWLAEVGAAGVVTTNPYVIQMIKQRYPELSVLLSSLVHVDSVDQALFFEQMGVDGIYLPEYLNRNFKLLRALRRQLRCDLIPIVNLACLIHCPFRDYHGNFISHSAKSLDRGCYLDYSLSKCMQIKATTPVEVIKAPWIRPEDLSRYEEIGFHHFKIAGREKGAEWVLRAVAAYSERSYAGLLNDLVLGLDRVDPFGDFPIALDNQRLDGFIDFFAGKDCRLGCQGCNHCPEWLERASSFNGSAERYGVGIERLLNRFTSGCFKAPQS